MLESVNWLSVAVAAAATFVIGGPWYSPLLFKNSWQKDMNLTNAQPGHPARVFGLSYLFSVVACVLLAELIGPGATGVGGLKLGLLIGLCFVAASFGINYQFANRPIRVWLIDAGYHVLQFAAFGLILGAWPG